MYKKSNFSIVIIAFWLLIFFSLFSIFNIFKTYPYNFKINGFGFQLEKITINLELNQKINNNSLICFNDFCTNMESDDFSNIYTLKFNENTKEFFNSKVKNIYLVYPQSTDFIKNIKMLNIYTGTKCEYFTKNDISKLNKKTFNIEIDNQTQKYNAIQIPFKTNYKGIFNHISILFLSLFYNFPIFIIPYFWIFIAFCLYFLNKEKFNFNFKLNNKNFIITFISIFLIGILLRINNLTYYPLWLDEIYTKTTAISSFKACFQDAGNLPLFYILELLISKIFDNGTLYLRLIPLVFGILFPIGAYLIFKKTSKQSGLFMMFLASINLASIYHSQEARVYSLSMTAGVFCIYFLFKYLEKQNTKNLIYYFLLNTLLINLHYYNIFLCLFNLLWGFLKIKNKKEKIKFIFSNILSFATILPYLFYSYKTAVSTNFNSWINPLNLNTFKYIIKEYFTNPYIFTIFCAIIATYFIAIITKNTKINVNKERKELFVYLVFSILFILISTSLISIFIKPILHKRLLLANYELLFLLNGVMILGIFQIKKFTLFKTIIQIILTFMFLYITKPMPLRDIYVLDDFMNFVEKDSIQYQNNYEVHCVTNDTEKYLDNYKNLKTNKHIIWHYVDTNSMEHIDKISKKDFIKNNKKGIIYLNDMTADINKIGFLNPNARIYHTNSIRNLKIIYE